MSGSPSLREHPRERVARLCALWANVCLCEPVFPACVSRTSPLERVCVCVCPCSRSCVCLRVCQCIWVLAAYVTEGVSVCLRSRVDERLPQ